MIQKIELPATSWASYFFEMIPIIKSRSKDKHTKVGCVITAEDEKTILSTGYNSFPTGLNDNVPERYERPMKYAHIEHAERNSIYNAAKMGVPLNKGVIYMESIPCNDCARAIIQCGIKKIYFNSETHKLWNSPKYDASVAEISLQMLEECGVQVFEVNII